MDSHTLELLNLELDGRLDASGRGELAARVKSDPEVALRREQLANVARVLAMDHGVELPSGFTDGVLEKAGMVGASPKRAARRHRRYWQVGLALAASTVFAVLALQVLDPPTPAGERQLTGAMAPAGPSVSTQVTDSGQLIRFSVPAGAAGEIHLRFADGERIVLPLAEQQGRVDLAARAGEFVATLNREGVVTPVTVHNR